MSTVTEDSTGHSRTATPARPSRTAGRGRSQRRGGTTTPGQPRRPIVRRGGLARSQAPRVPFVLLVLGLLGAAMLAGLVLHTALAHDAHVLAELREDNRALSQQEEQLREDVLHGQSPEALAEEAEELGMEPGSGPQFLDSDSGEIVGSPAEAQ